MKEIQDKVSELVKKYDLESSIEVRYIDLVSEVGELGKEILKSSRYGKKNFSSTKDFELELGDVLFSLICVANSLNMDLDQVFSNVLKKYHDRFSTKGDIGSGN